MPEARPITVTLHVATDPETGECWVVRDESYFDQALALARAELEQQHALSVAQGTPQKQAKSDLGKALALVESGVAARRAEHAAARAGAEALTFSLRRLTFGDATDAVAAATDALGVTDPAALGIERLSRSLLLEDGEGHRSPDAVRVYLRELEPVVCLELMARVGAMVQSDPRRLALLNGRG